ncbi:MAG: hypothetical protein AAGE03_11810 [Pseudomonadota bacterium]
MMGSVARIVIGAVVAIGLLAWFVPASLWTGGLLVLLVALLLVIRSWRAKRQT